MTEAISGTETPPTLEALERKESGGGEIRTHGPREEPTVFKTVPLDRSGTPPGNECSYEPGSIRSGAPNGFSASGTSPWKFSRIASAQRSVTAVPFSVCTCSMPCSPR